MNPKEDKSPRQPFHDASQSNLKMKNGAKILKTVERERMLYLQRKDS